MNQMATSLLQKERALLDALTAMDRVIGAIFVRWSLDEHELLLSEEDFLDTVRQLAGLATLARRAEAAARLSQGRRPAAFSRSGT